MYKIDFNQPCHIHFIGIGGISMSGLAEILLEEGFTVSGSDNKESALTDHLSQNGATGFYGQKASIIIDGIYRSDPRRQRRICRSKASESSDVVQSRITRSAYD